MNSHEPAVAVQTTFFSGVDSDFPLEKRKILIVAESMQGQGLAEILRPEGYAVSVVDSVEAATGMHSDFGPDVVLLEVEGAGESAFAFCRQLRSDYGGTAPAVIFLANQTDPAEVVDGLAAGGVDFLSGPFGAEVLARIRVHVLNRLRISQLKREELAKNRLLCMAAHDLRNPLVSIRALTNLVRAGTVGEVNPSQRDLLDTIYDASQSMLDLVNELLDVSVLEAGEMRFTPRPTSLAHVVDACVRLYNGNAGQKGSVILLQAGQLPPILALDEPKIRQVLGNLLGNAIKFSPPGSEITVISDCTADECIVAIRDQGPGIRTHERERLFKDFSRTSAKPTGGESSTGLGLSICRKIMQAHGGTIEVVDAPGGGAEFRITFPITG